MMRRASRNKRNTSARAQERATFSLMVHGPEYGAGEEVVINPECFPQIKVNDLVEISQPERDHRRLVLQVTTLAPVRGKLQVSVLKDIAAQFGLEPFLPVTVQRADPREVTVDFIELSFKDQFLSRADIWRFKVAMLDRCVYVGKNVACLGIRSQVEGLLANNQDLYCGVIGADTKMIVRSRSSRMFWLVQMSAEMWEFAPDGELYYEKLLNRLLRVMISKWNESSVSHSVTIIAFSRSFYDKNQFPEDYDPSKLPFSEPTRQGVVGPGCTRSGTKTASGYGPTIHVDPHTGRYYEDFYKVLVMNYTGPDWSHLLGILKREFTSYHETHRWRSPEEVIPAVYKVHQCSKESSLSQSDDSSGEQIQSSKDDEANAAAETTKNDDCYVQWETLPFGIPSRAMDGNILEAINVTLNILDKHYMDRDLNRTGQSIVMITAGCSIFNVDERLAQITKQRMMDNGVGMDMISLTTPPMHVVPLFICQKSAAGTPFCAVNTRYQHAAEDQSVRRQRNYSISSDNLSALETCSLRGLEKEISDFEQPNWGDDEANPASSESSSQEGDEEQAGNAQESVLQGPERIYSIPHWVNITFLDFDCRCGDDTSTTSGERHFRAQSQSCSPTNAGSARPPYNNRLLSHRAQTCECQYYLNQQFMPLPPFRMFDLTAPTERLSFPVALKNLIKGYPRNLQRSEKQPVPLVVIGEETPGARQALRRRKLSDISLVSSAVFPEELQISRSPDYDFSLSATMKNRSSNYNSSFACRDAFQEYDAEVFSTSSILGLNSPDKECRQGFSPPRYSEQDLTSATFNGDTNPLDAALQTAKNNKWSSISNHGRGIAKAGFGRGSSSIIGSLLSPRNEMTIYSQRQSSSSSVRPTRGSFKRISTVDGLAETGAAGASSGVTIPSAQVVKPPSTRKSAVYPKRSLQLEKEQSDNESIMESPASGDQDSSAVHQQHEKKTRSSATAIDTSSKPMKDHEEHDDLTPQSPDEKILGKSFDSSRQFFTSRSIKERDDSKPSSVLMRSRACTSNVEGSSTPPLAPQPPRDSSFQNLSRSMTMGKPSPSYYNDLLLRSPPVPPAIAPSLSVSNENSYLSQRQSYTQLAARRGHSEVLSSSVLTAAVMNMGSQPPGLPMERPRTTTSTNPFKYPTDTLETTSQRLTSDRRRWSHLFPVLTTIQQHQASAGNPEIHQHGGVKPIHLGPNWKSLTSPAILPLTTDYYPSAKDLHTSYTESFYTLTLPSTMSETVPKYNDHDELLIEMVCQRLASDFQLVATDSSTDLDPAYHHVPAVITNRGPSGESRSPNNTIIYYLSMGHRIHQMIYDPELQTIDVKRYFQRDIQSQKNEAKNYRYSLWVDFTESFHPLQQKFHEYPQPEENWNSLDHLLCGYHDEMSDLTKCRRIRFAIVPPVDSSSTAADYTMRFKKLMDYLETRIAPAEDGVKEKISIRIANHEVLGNQQLPLQPGTLSYKICCKSSSCSSSRIRSDDTRAEWIMIHLEDTMDVSRNYHLDMRWLACSGIVADDFVSTLKRKSKQSGLEIRRVPEYSRISFLQIHPVIAPIFLPLPLRMLHRESNTLCSDQEKSLITILVERMDFVLDDVRLADSNGIGYGLGIEREERKPLGSGYKVHYRQQRRSASSAARLMAERWRTRGYKQYMHRHVPVFLRLIHNGLVWIPSYDYDEK
ncbi:Dep domain-containing protein, partial [Globisporangium polare]